MGRPLGAEGRESAMALQERLVRCVTVLLDETFAGPPGRSSWYTDSYPGSGLFGTLDAVPAGAASTPPGSGRTTIAAHLEHLRFSLNLANRALRGEDPYPTADWKASWAVQQVDDAAWERLRASLRDEYLALREAVQSPDAWIRDDDALTGVLAAIAHCAYHLGALRQMIRLLALEST